MTAAELLTLAKVGLAAYNFLKKIPNDETEMSVEWLAKQNRIIFTAIRSSWWTRLLTCNIPECAISPDVEPFCFQVIEIVCGTDAIFLNFLNRFQRDEKTTQNKIMDYFKIYFEKSNKETEEVSTTIECIKQGQTWVPAGPFNENDSGDYRYWNLYKLTYTIKKLEILSPPPAAIPFSSPDIPLSWLRPRGKHQWNDPSKFRSSSNKKQKTNSWWCSVKFCFIACFVLLFVFCFFCYFYLSSIKKMVYDK
jgi:hypothetical protein